MPIPWKKGRFSRMVTNHLNSAKQSGTLVVETGFPTSLIDLFVKNRERSSNKKKKDRKQSTGDEPSSPVYSSPARSISCPESVIPSPAISRTSSFTSSPVIWRTPNHHHHHHSFSGSPIRQIESESSAAAVDLKLVLIAIIKVFFVVALGLSTNQFIVGLIISTFILISMEFIGNYLKPCQKAQIIFRHFVEQVPGVTRMKNNQTQRPRCSIEGQNQIQESKPSSKPSHLKPPRGIGSEEFPIGGNLIHCKSLNCLSEEMDKNHHHHHHSRNGNGNSKLRSKIIKMLTTSKKKDEIENPISDSDKKSSKSRSSRLKSKIKKIILMKNSKKKHQQLPLQTNEQDNCPIIEEPIVCYREEEEQSCTSPTEIMGDNEENREVDAVFAPKQIVEERRGDFDGCWVFLLPIILMGLVGGRFWAIVLTLAWCSIWKLTAWMLWKSSFSSSSS